MRCSCHCGELCAVWELDWLASHPQTPDYSVSFFISLNSGVHTNICEQVREYMDGRVWKGMQYHTHLVLDCIELSDERRVDFRLYSRMTRALPIVVPIRSSDHQANCANRNTQRGNVPPSAAATSYEVTIAATLNDNQPFTQWLEPDKP